MKAAGTIAPYSTASAISIHKHIYMIFFKNILNKKRVIKYREEKYKILEVKKDNKRFLKHNASNHTPDNLRKYNEHI